MPFNTHSNENKISTGIPDSLKEFGEIPRDYVSVYRVVPQNYIEGISQNGILAKEKAHPRPLELEEIFSQEARKSEVNADRKIAIFAMPKDSYKSKTTDKPHYRRNSTDVVLEIKVNPRKSI